MFEKRNQQKETVRMYKLILLKDQSHGPMAVLQHLYFSTAKHDCPSDTACLCTLVFSCESAPADQNHPKDLPHVYVLKNKESEKAATNFVE